MFNETNIAYLSEKYGLDLSPFVSAFNSFFVDSGDFTQLTSLYSGRVSKVPVNAFKNLFKLKDIFNEASEAFKRLTEEFDNVLDWELFEMFETAGLKIQEVKVMGKFMRSSFSFPAGLAQNTIQYTLNHETIEEALRNSFNVENNQDVWSRIAIDNDLLEVDYDTEGGNSLLVRVDLNINQFPINSVIDFMAGDNVLGKDLHRVLQFEDDDLLALQPRETVLQSVDILAAIIQGEAPEFPNLGRTPIIGNRYNAFIASSIVRQLADAFGTDDTLTRFKVLSFDTKDFTSPVLKLSVETRLLRFDKTIKISNQ